MVERIKKLIASTGTSTSKVLQEINLPGSAITEWSKGKAKPSLDALIKIADYFNVSVDYLLGRASANSVEAKTVTDNHGIIGHTHAPVTINNTTEKKLTPQELELLNIFNQLSVINQSKLLLYAAELK